MLTISHDAMIALSWAIATLGVGGAVAAVAAVIYLGPAAVVAIVRPLLARFFACTRCVVGAAVLLAVVAAYWLGHHQAEVQCRAADRESVAAAARQDIFIAQGAARDEANRAIDIEVAAKQRRESDADYIARLETRPESCGFDPDAGAGGVRGPRAARPQPAAGAGAADAGAAGAAPRQRLFLPLVPGRWLQGKGRAGDAALDR